MAVPMALSCYRSVVTLSHYFVVLDGLIMTCVFQQLFGPPRTYSLHEVFGLSPSKRK